MAVHVLDAVDAWFDGIKYMDGHFSSGPLNRALYFLTRGAPATPATTTTAPICPAG